MYTYSPGSMEEEEFDTCLGLGIGGCGSRSYGRRMPGHGERRPPVQFDVLFPPQIKEGRGCDNHQQAVNKKGGRQKRKIGDDRAGGRSLIDGGDGGDCARKKLRLTKEQSTLLEESFRAHNILSHAQKHELARELNLSPRQVEVWFQNRRARTKFKQTEIDCEFLRRRCSRLTNENMRLKHELTELRPSAAAGGPQLYLKWPAVAATATVSVCPSCEKVTVASEGEMSKGSIYCS